MRPSEGDDLSDVPDGAQLIGLIDDAVDLVAAARATGDRVSLATAIHNLEVARRTAPGVLMDTVLVNLGMALNTRFEMDGNIADLSEAVVVSRDAVKLTPVADPRRAGRVSNLGVALKWRYEFGGGELADLQESIACQREAAELTAQKDPERSKFATNLANTLLMRFGHTAAAPDLDESIGWFEAALAATPVTHPRLARRRANLANALSSRYDLLGARTDLDAAVSLLQQAVAATAPNDPALAADLSNLGNAFLSDYERTGSYASLDTAVLHLEGSIARTARNDPQLPHRLSNLASALSARGSLTSSLADFDAAISATDRALGSLTDDQPAFARVFFNFGSLLRSRFSVSGDLIDLDAAIEYMHAAISALPPAAPLLCVVRTTLGKAIEDRAEITGSQTDLGSALTEYLAAMRVDTAAPMDRCVAAMRAAALSTAQDASACYAEAITLLPSVLQPWLDRTDTLARVAALSGLGMNAAAAYLATDQPRQALSAVEHGRALTLSGLIQLRGDFDKLQTAHPETADRLSALLKVLNAPRKLRAADAARDLSAQENSRRREAQSQLTPVLERIRTQPGFEQFFLPPDPDQLVAGGREGPIVVVNVARTRCDALVVNDGDVDVVELKDLTAADCADAAMALLSATDQLFAPDVPDKAFAAAEADLIRLLAWAWDRIADPVLTHLGFSAPRSDSEYGAWPRIWWVPTGPLTVFPMHAAGYHSASNAGEPARERTVMDRVVSSTVPSISALLHARTRPLADLQPRALLLAMPTTPGLPELESVIDEVERVARLIPRADVTMIGVDPSQQTGEPSRRTVLGLLPTHAWTHFACHGEANPTDPAKSNLVLADHQSDPLTVEDIVGLKLEQAQLAYFSACTTARPGRKVLDEPVHFAAAALLAGYRHAIGTLWPIPDRPHSAETIYRILSSDGFDWTAASAAVAVHTAVHGERRAFPDQPQYWAALLHQGP